MKIENCKLKINRSDKGAIITLVLVFGAVFVLMLAALLGFILLQLRQSSQKAAWHQALHIAESGVNYYRWCLNNDIGPSCNLTKDYNNALGAKIGEFSLTIDSQAVCGEVTEQSIKALGWTDKFSQTKREVGALYARESVGKYAYLLNENVWAGADREIRGLYHSNGGIRMDGENQSLATSAQNEWVCTGSFGCDPCPTSDGCYVDDSDCKCPGVFTTTDNPRIDLFDFPVVSFDFEGITIDLAQMKNLAQTNPSGIYLPPSTDINPGGLGWHLVFQNNGTFEARIITDLEPSWAYSQEEEWHWDYFIINSEYLDSSYPIDADCALVFIEDDLWIEGEVNGKVTVASADLISPTNDTDVVLPGNISYTVLDGADGLSVVGERNVLISPDSPDDMELRGIFIAQKGHFGRNHYGGNIKDKLEISGSVVSNGRVGTKWSSGGQVVSGYLQRENYFDADLVYTPPPFVPVVSAEYELMSWEEVE